MNPNYTHPEKTGSLIFFALLISIASSAQIKSQTSPQSQTAAAQTGGPREQATRLLKKNMQPAGLSQTELNSYLITDAYADKKAGLFTS